MNVLGVIGILTAFFMVIFLSYKGLNLVYVIIAACFVVIVTNGMNFIETFENVIMAGIGEQAASLLAVYLFGALFGKVFIDSGAAQSFTNGLMNILAKNADDERRRTTALMVLIFTGALLCYVGIDTNASMVTMIGLGVGLFSATGIPRRFLPVSLVVSTTIGFTMPGSANMIPVMISNMMGTTSLSGAVPGAIGALFVFIASILLLKSKVRKAVAAGEIFEYGPLEPVKETSDHQPHPIVAVLPLLAVILLYNLANLPAWLAIACGLGISMILFYTYMPIPEERLGGSSLVGKFWGLVETLNSGTMLAAVAAIFLFNFSLGLVINEAPAFQIIQNFFTSLNLPALVSLAIMCTVLVGASAGPGGVIISVLVATSVYIPEMGISAAACHRIIVAATAILDTLPFGGGCVMIMAMTNIKMKEGYPPIFQTTILFTAIGLIIVTALLMLFPGLA